MTNAFLYQEIKIVVATHLELFCLPIKMKLLFIKVRIVRLMCQPIAQFNFFWCQKYVFHNCGFPKDIFMLMWHNLQTVEYHHKNHVANFIGMQKSSKWVAIANAA